MKPTKAVKEVITIAKYTLKSNGAVIYRVRSNQPNKHGKIEGRDQVEHNGQYFDAYMVTSDGETVCGCQCGDEQCQGSKYRGTCCHRTHAQGLLDAAKKVIETPAQPVITSTVTDLGSKGTLNGASTMPSWLSVLPSRQQKTALAS